MEPNMYEVAARNKKAAKLALILARGGCDRLPEGPEFDARARRIAEVAGIRPPSDETLAQVRAYLAGE